MRITIKQATDDNFAILQEFSTTLYTILHQYDETVNTDIATVHDGQYIRINLSDPTHYYAIAFEKDKPLGYMLCILRDNRPYRSFLRAELEELYVINEVRGKGIGMLLIKAFVKWSKQVGAKSMIIEALSNNIDAMRLYERMGFTSLNIRLEQKVT